LSSGPATVANDLSASVVARGATAEPEAEESAAIGRATLTATRGADRAAAGRSGRLRYGLVSR